MSKQNYIDNIEALFPIDSEFPDTNEVGRRLLMETIESFDWRELPENILRIYSAKCISEENRQARTPSKFAY